MNRILTILVLISVASACENYHYIAKPGNSVDFYLIKEMQRQTNSYKIITSSVKLSDSIIIRYENILSYNPETYTFTITKQIADKLNAFETYNTHGLAFALTLDKQIIYTGYFWASFSSAVLDWITIDPLDYSGKNLLTVKLGYPGLIEGDYIPDNRNDSRILEVFLKDSKIKDK